MIKEAIRDMMPMIILTLCFAFMGASLMLMELHWKMTLKEDACKEIKDAGALDN